MSSEKQHPSSVTLHRAVRLFIAGSSLFGQTVAETLGLHPTDMQFLNLLDLLGPMTPGALAQRSGLSRGGVTIVVDRLVKAGYVKRGAMPGDRRSLLVSICRSRQKRVTTNYESARRQLERAIEGFTDKELETVLRFFVAVNAPLPPA
jgi:MarR family transcriptional regulator, organic hydroperoxide resistance regulator